MQTGRASLRLDWPLAPRLASQSSKLHPAGHPLIPPGNSSSRRATPHPAGHPLIPPGTHSSPRSTRCFYKPAYEIASPAPPLPALRPLLPSQRFARSSFACMTHSALPDPTRTLQDAASPPRSRMPRLRYGSSSRVSATVQDAASPLRSRMPRIRYGLGCRASATVQDAASPPRSRLPRLRSIKRRSTTLRSTTLRSTNRCSIRHRSHKRLLWSCDKTLSAVRQNSEGRATKL
ncbi:uncharacterized protein SCHCODRAFT_02673668 [Schizophyllum commune H4-8]|uniref:uncharacterized protein n=1 Tax=Schizophyllum commune (strain H4-8 / FGSC 9210) TaxID=578458 RepID=UPI002160EA8B|nr:uncharacterized protein SCHCODRAFT_02673668 [Schizophyllum commune H4-8]KAI5885026.1 hypothetical protein SCHCODRAFT_02673668 [Schizophyllum commune H4-8]